MAARPRSPSSGPATVPVAVDRCYTLWLWIDARVMDFPVTARHGVGALLVQTVIAALDGLVEASYSPSASADRLAALRRANHRVALLRLLVRGARERHYLSIPQYEYATKLLLSPEESALIALGHHTSQRWARRRLQRKQWAEGPSANAQPTLLLSSRRRHRLLRIPTRRARLDRSRASRFALGNHPSGARGQL